MPLNKTKRCLIANFATVPSLPGLEILTGQRLVLKIMPTATLIHTCGLKQATTAMNISNGEAARAPQQKT